MIKNIDNIIIKDEYGDINECLTETIRENLKYHPKNTARIICGTDEMFDGNEFYQYELMCDNKIMKNYYDTAEVNGDFGNIDYSKPYKVVDIGYTWSE